MSEPIMVLKVEFRSIEDVIHNNTIRVVMTCEGTLKNDLAPQDLKMDFCCLPCAVQAMGGGMAQYGVLMRIMGAIQQHQQPPDDDPSEAWKKGGE